MWIGLAGCGGGSDRSDVLHSSAAIHLEDHLDAATVEVGASVGATAEVAWAGDALRQAFEPLTVSSGASSVSPTEDGLRIDIPADALFNRAGIYAPLDDLSFGDWEKVVVRARARDKVSAIRVGFNYEGGRLPSGDPTASATSVPSPMIADGDVYTYSLPVERPPNLPNDAPWTSLALVVNGHFASVEILSVRLVPLGSGYEADYGITSEPRGETLRRAIYVRTPARLSYRVDVPADARLDFGISVTRPDIPIEFRVTAARASGDRVALFEKTSTDPHQWSQHAVDLSGLAGETVTLSLEAGSEERPGMVALWGAPTLSAGRRADRPNVIFYVIDGGGADFMSVYGYNRRTTPFLERLADEGAVFERAYSSSTWTQPSTVSFMTSIHHSVAGGLRRGMHSAPMPLNVKTMAEHFHDAGYQTASFTTNSNAGRLIGMDRGVDVLNDSGAHAGSSAAELHDRYWRFRTDFPAEPYWVHFQTTDVHPPYAAEPPIAGLFTNPDERDTVIRFMNTTFATGMRPDDTPFSFYRRVFAEAEEDPATVYQAFRSMHDEAMAQQDTQLERLVERLKSAGEWESTLLVIGADHGHPAGSFPRFGRGLLDPQPPDWEGALFGSFNSHVPLIFVWPGHIEGGRRFREPVSMIDVLPTLLALTGLPEADVAQGRSLTPLLLGTGDAESAPVILDEFRVDGGGMIGNIEIVDGRWGASLEVSPVAPGADPENGRRAIPAGGRYRGAGSFADAPRLLLFDLLEDPLAVRHVNERYPELVREYARELQKLWAAHQALGLRVSSGDDREISPEQLENLRSLGYIQ